MSSHSLSQNFQKKGKNPHLRLHATLKYHVLFLYKDYFFAQISIHYYGPCKMPQTTEATFSNGSFYWLIRHWIKYCKINRFCLLKYVQKNTVHSKLVSSLSYRIRTCPRNEQKRNTWLIAVTWYVYIHTWVHTQITHNICAYAGVCIPIHMCTYIHKHICTKSTDWVNRTLEKCGLAPNEVFCVKIKMIQQGL